MHSALLRDVVVHLQEGLQGYMRTYKAQKIPEISLECERVGIH